MAGGLIKETRAIDHSPALWVGGGKDQPTDAREADGPGAHGARLEGDGHGKFRQSVIANRQTGLTQGGDFGVGGGIMAADGRIGSLGDDLLRHRVEDHGPHRHFSHLSGGLRLIQSEAHHSQVMVGNRNHRRGTSPPGQAGRQVDSAPVPEGERVAKVLARAGVASRREIERLIEGGRVVLNGEILKTPAVKVGRRDLLTVDGAPVEAAEPTRLFLYHKPPGLVTTHSDPKGRPTVFKALPRDLPRLISVGRLDLASEGLLLLTNDGGLSRALELPAAGLVRRYRARARGRIDQKRLDGLKAGITVEGVIYDAIEAKLDKVKEGPAGANLWITLSLAEGKNREVRRVLEALGLSVNRLIRIAYGPFALGALDRGGVEEVGPRVIREQLGHLIEPGHLPKGDRAQYRVTPPVLDSSPARLHAVKPRARKPADAVEAGGKSLRGQTRVKKPGGFAKNTRRPSGPSKPRTAGKRPPPSGR